MKWTIREIAKNDPQIPPRELTTEAGGSLATQADAAGQRRTLFAIYEATVPLHLSRLSDAATTLTVKVDPAGGQEEFSGRIVFVSPEIQPVTNQVRCGRN